MLFSYKFWNIYIDYTSQNEKKLSMQIFMPKNLYFDDHPILTEI